MTKEKEVTKKEKSVSDKGRLEVENGG